jgi:hypothetical protein
LDHVGVQVDGSGCFTWPVARWQLYIIRNYVFAPKACATKAILDELRGAGAIRPAFYYVPKALEAALESSPIGFLTPYKAVDAYLKHLADSGVLFRVRYGCFSRMQRFLTRLCGFQLRERASGDGRPRQKPRVNWRNGKLKWKSKRGRRVLRLSRQLLKPI